MAKKTSNSSPRKSSPKQMGHFIVGSWHGELPRKNFVPLETQPEEAISTLGEIVSWTRENIKEPGEYQFIRSLPQKLTLVAQTKMDSILS